MVRVRAPAPAHLIEDLAAIREHHAQQRRQAQQSEEQQAQEQKEHDGLSRHALVNTNTAASSRAQAQPAVKCSPEETVRAVAKELAQLEPAVRVHESGATARLTALHARLKLVLDDRNVELEPELDIAAQDMITKMNHLIQAAQANVFKGVIKGPQEYAQEARFRELKEALALKWEIEDLRARRSDSHKKSKSASATAADESKPSKPRSLKKRKSASAATEVVVKQKPAGFGSKRYEAALLADHKLKARDAKRRRAAGLATQVQEESEEEEREMSDEDDEDHAEDEEEDLKFVTPKRSKTSPASFKHGAGAVTPSTAGGAAASASLPRDPTFAPQQHRQTRSGEPRSRTARARALEPTLRNLPVEDASSQQATQPMEDDGETPQIFLTVAAQRKAEKAAAAAASASAAAESPLLISKRANMAAPEYIAKKLPTPARRAAAAGASSAAAASASLPLPNAALLVANSQAGLFSLEDEAVVDSADARRKIRQMQLAAGAATATATGKSKSMENQTPRRAAAAAAAASSSSSKLDKDPFAFDL